MTLRGGDMSARRDGDPRPDRPEPGPFFAQSAPWLDERMFDHRIVLVRGRIDAAMANHVVGALLVLGRSGPDPVQLFLSAPDGELAAAFAIVDAIETAGVPVHAVVTSE